MRDDEDDFELDLIVTMLRGIREYIGASLIMDQVVDIHSISGADLDSVVDATFESIIGPIRGNKANSDAPFTNEDAHAILDAVAKWRLDNPDENPRPPALRIDL